MIVCSVTSAGEYMKLAHLWAKNMERLEIKYRVYCTDDKSFDFLTSRGVNAYNLKRSQKIGNWKRVGLTKIDVIKMLLKEGEDFILCDTDVFFFKKCFDEINQTMGEKGVIGLSQGRRRLYKGAFGFNFCGGWILVRPRIESVEFFKDVERIFLMPSSKKTTSRLTVDSRSFLNTFQHALCEAVKKARPKGSNSGNTFELKGCSFVIFPQNIIQRIGNHAKIVNNKEKPKAPIVHVFGSNSQKRLPVKFFKFFLGED